MLAEEEIITPASVALLHLQQLIQPSSFSSAQLKSQQHEHENDIENDSEHPQRTYFNPFTSDNENDEIEIEIVHENIVSSRDEANASCLRFYHDRYSPQSSSSNAVATAAAAAAAEAAIDATTKTAKAKAKADSNLDSELEAMTKQLTTTATTTTSATTISAANLAPTAVSPTVNIIIAAGSNGVAASPTLTSTFTSTISSTSELTAESTLESTLPTSNAVIEACNVERGDESLSLALSSTTEALKASLVVSIDRRNPSANATHSILMPIMPSAIPQTSSASPTTTTTNTTTITTTTTPAKPLNNVTPANNEASGRSAALERAYVHDVYEHCEEPTGPIRPRVAQFLSNLDPGSVVCDVGCGSGRYLTQCNPAICTVGVDRCHRLSRVAHEKGGEVALCDNLELPFRDESFDAVLSLAVVHHFATTERRVNALRELARILRIGGRVVITVWALEQRHRRFESQDVLIPWQPPRNRNFNYSDDEDDDDFLPPYHAYTEDSTNSSRSAGDGDSSSLSSSSPGESCYSFVRRAIQKLAGGRKHPWFLESWTSKETKNDSSLDYEDAKDLPIELRRLEDFEDFTEPPLSAGLKSRSLGSILNPPPRQIVRSRSSVPSLGGPLHLLHNGSNNGVGDKSTAAATTNAQFLSASNVVDHNGIANNGGNNNGISAVAGGSGHSPTHMVGNGVVSVNGGGGGGGSAASTLGRRPKLIKQKQSLCDEDYQQSENPFHMISSYNTNNHSFASSLYLKSGCYHHHAASADGTTTNSGSPHHRHTPRQSSTGSTGSTSGVGNGSGQTATSIFLRKQSSLNEELMAGNRLREKERVRKRIQKQNSLNEAFLCRSAIFSKRLQVIREGFTSKFKSSTGSLERATKTGLTKIMQNIKAGAAAADGMGHATHNRVPHSSTASVGGGKYCAQHHHQHQHHHHHHMHQTTTPTAPSPAASGGYRSHFAHMLHRQTLSGSGSGTNKFAGPVVYCNSAECASTSNSVCYCSAYHHGCGGCCGASGGSSSGTTTTGGDATTNTTSTTGNNAQSPGPGAGDDPETKARRHSRESGSDSSKDSSLQSDTSIESEDSFASVIFIPKPEQHQQQLNYQQQHQNSNSSSSNSSSSNGGCQVYGAGACCCHPKGCCCAQQSQTQSQSMTQQQQQQSQQQQQHQMCTANSSHTPANCKTSQCTGGHHHHQHHYHHHRSGGAGGSSGGPPTSVPTSPLIMPCPPTPAHSPAAAQITVTSPPQTMAAVTAAMAILTPPCSKRDEVNFTTTIVPIGNGEKENSSLAMPDQSVAISKNRFTFDEAHIKQQQEARQSQNQQVKCNSEIENKQSGEDRSKTISINTNNTANKQTNVNKHVTRITRQIVNELPPIPKFRKQQSLHLQRQSFPIVRRSSAGAGAGTSLPKLLSLELFNPATDDLDSDSSEPSSPDSIDSVISAPKSASISLGASGETVNAIQPKTGVSDIANMKDFEHSSNPSDLKINRAASNDIILNADSANILPIHHPDKNGSAATETSQGSHGKQPQDCNEFAELLSAQLMREIEDKNNRVECRSLDAIAGDLADYLDDPLAGNGGSRGELKKRHAGGGGVVEQQRDLAALREELRERRLMLANLSTQQSLQQSPTSSSTSSLSSQTRSFTIHEEDEDEDEEENERSYTLQLYENCKISKFNYKRHRQYNLNPETAYLLQDDGDSSVRDEEDEMEDFDHDVIFEEDEDDADETQSSVAICHKKMPQSVSTTATTITTNANSNHNMDKRNINSSKTNSDRHHKNANNNSKMGKVGNGGATICEIKSTPARATTQSMRQTTAESWEHSNSSTTSLDSPSQGGATTHHRYYHVFREGELDALINHHVTSLHIVSSYYERASWCVVAEKVQVWTI